MLATVRRPSETKPCWICWRALNQREVRTIRAVCSASGEAFVALICQLQENGGYDDQDTPTW